jgi:hypothetical protein
MKRLTSQLERLQVFTRLKANGLSGGDVHFGSGSWISSDASLSRLYGENTKPAQLNPIIGFQRVLHTVEDRIDSLLGLGLADACSLHDLIHKIQLDHGGILHESLSRLTSIFLPPWKGLRQWQLKQIPGFVAWPNSME